MLSYVRESGNVKVGGQVAPLRIDRKEIGSQLSYPAYADFLKFKKGKGPQLYGGFLDNREMFGSYMLKQSEVSVNNDNNEKK